MHRWKIRPQAYGMLIHQARKNRSPREVIQRLVWLQYGAVHGVSAACRRYGISRSTFVRWSERFNPSDALQSLSDQSKRPISVRVPETDEKTVEIIRTLRKAYPTLGKNPIASLLQERYGITISSATVGRIIKRHHLFFSSAKSHQQKRLNAGEEQSLDIASRIPESPTNSSDTAVLIPRATS